MDISPAGKGASSRATPFGKRLRSPPHQDPWRSPAAGCEAFDEIALDNTMATDLSRLNMAFGEEPSLASGGSARGASSPSLSSMQTDRDSSGGAGAGAGGGSPTLSDCFNPFDSPSVHSREPLRPPFAGMHGRAVPGSSPPRPGLAPAASPVRLRPGSAAGSGGGPPGTPMVCGTPARNGGSNLGRSSGRGGGVAALEAAERLPPSPSDPQMGMDLRKTALLRSLLLRTEEKCKATPGAVMRRGRSRMSDALLASPGAGGGGRRLLGGARRSLPRIGSPDGCAEMDMATGSLSSDEELELQDESVHGSGSGSGIFSLSDTEDLKLRQRASLILGDAARSRARLDAYDLGLRH